jgi:DNA-binding XRE family transcriptional regulator
VRCTHGLQLETLSKASYNLDMSPGRNVDTSSSDFGAFGPRLRMLRRRAVMTQRELAEASGVAQVTIAFIEAGRQEPRPRTIRKLARALAVKPTALTTPEPA